MNPTIRDVARRAGVSITTASRVLSNSKHPVAAGVRQRVLQVAQELDFTPNAYARGLSKRDFRLIGLLVPDVRDPYFVEIARGVEDLASQHGYMIVLCNTDRNPAKERRYVEELRAMRAGIILLGSAIGREDHLMDLANHPAPVVVIGRHELPCSSVLIDNHRGAVDATTHLIQLGHRRIAYVGGPRNASSAIDRIEGFREAMAHEGVAVEERLVIEGDYVLDTGVSAVEQLLKLPDPPTALFAANDQMAMGALREARRRGCRVPQDLAIVGFNGIPATAQTDPPLTTILLPLHEMGQMAAEMVLKQLKNSGIERSSILVRGKLVVRESTVPTA